MAEILTCAGFFLIYFIEECVHFFMDSGVSDESRQIHRSFRCGFQASLIDRNEAATQLSACCIESVKNVINKMFVTCTRSEVTTRGC